VPNYLLRLRDKAGTRVVGELEQEDQGTATLTIENDEKVLGALLGQLDLLGIDAVPVEGNVLAEDCSENAHRACDLTLVITWAADFAKTHHIPAPALEQMAEDMNAPSEAAVRAALDELIANTPDQAGLQDEARGYLSFLFQ
jgi:hypothetical protein